MTKSLTITTEFDRFDQIADRPMAAALEDITRLISTSMDVMTSEDTERVQRFHQRLVTIGAAEVGSGWFKGVRAEVGYQIRDEQDFRLFVNPATEEPYKNWTEFRDVLAQALRVSPATLANHIKLVQIGRQVLGLAAGEFPSRGGITTVGHIQRVCAGLDGREGDDYGITVRPKTKKFQKILEADYPGADYPEMLAKYYNESVAHDYEDPSAINRPARELGEQERDVLGSPDFRVKVLSDKGRYLGYEFEVTYPDIEEEDGQVIVGETDIFQILWKDQFIPQPVIDWINRRLRAR